MRVAFAENASLAPLVALGAVLWTFSDLLSADRIPAYRDLLLFVVPIKYFLSEELRRGEIPLWNPYIHLGTPFLAGLQTAIFYPLSLLLITPFPAGLNLFLLAHYFVALTGMWALLHSRGMAAAPCAVGALSFTIGGYLVSMLNVTNHLQAAVWAPWLLLGWESYRNRPNTFRWLIFVALISIQILAGAPEVLLMTLGLVAAWTMLGSVSDFQQTARLAVAFAAALASATALTALQVLPTLEYLRQSARSGPLEFTEVTTWSLEPVSLLQLLFPHSSGPQPPWGVAGLGYRFERIAPWIRSIYVGVVPLCLAIVGLTCARERGFWAAVLVVALVLAFGKHTPIFQILYHSVPPIFARFRYPEKFYFLLAFGVAILAAEGAQELLGRSRSAQRITTAAALTLLCIAVAILMVRRLWPMSFLWAVEVVKAEPNSKSLIALAADLALKCHRLAWLAGALALLGSLGLRGLVAERTSAALLVMLIGGDLATINNHLNLAISWKDLNARPLGVDVRELQQTHGRIFHYQTVGAAGEGIQATRIQGIDEWAGGATEDSNLEEFYKDAWTALLGNRVMMVHVEAIGGADGIHRNSDRALRETLLRLPRDHVLKILRTLSCAYLIGPAPLEVADLERVSRDVLPSVFTYRVHEPLANAYLASELRIAGSDPASFETVGSINFRPGIDAVVSELPPGWRNSEIASSPGTATIVARDGRLTRLLVQASRPALLVSNDSYFSGWEARVDGSPAKIYKTNGMVRGVVVEPGDRIVEFRYRPIAWTAGLYTSAVAFAALSTLGFFALRSQRSGRLGER